MKHTVWIVATDHNDLACGDRDQYNDIKVYATYEEALGAFYIRKKQGVDPSMWLEEVL